MTRLKIVLPLLLACLLFPRGARAGEVEDAYAGALNLLDKCPTCAQKLNGELYGYLKTMTGTVSETIEEEILKLQWDILHDSSNHPQIREVALAGLRLQKRDSVIADVRSYLSEDTLRTMAASVMVEWEFYAE
jgi:hypothetical protein